MTEHASSYRPSSNHKRPRTYVTPAGRVNHDSTSRATSRYLSCRRALAEAWSHRGSGGRRHRAQTRTSAHTRSLVGRRASTSAGSALHDSSKRACGAASRRRRPHPPPRCRRRVLAPGLVRAVAQHRDPPEHGGDLGERAGLPQWDAVREEEEEYHQGERDVVPRVDGRRRVQRGERLQPLGTRNRNPAASSSLFTSLSNPPTRLSTSFVACWSPAWRS